MSIIIDRISQGLAFCECGDGESRMIAVSELPEGVKEGDILAEKDGLWSVDREETDRRRQRMKDRLKRLIE